MTTGFTRKERLEQAGPNDLAITLSSLKDDDGRGFGTIIESVAVPKLTSRTNLTSSDEHIEPLPGFVFGVVEGGTNQTLIYGGSPGGNEVLVEYITDPAVGPVGAAKLTFNGAVTAYDIVVAAMPETIAAKLAEAT